MHALEKILAKNSGRETVKAGEIITAKIDFAEINDLYLQTVYSFYEMGGERVWDNERCAFVFDHYAPCPDVKSASNHKEMREFAKKNNAVRAIYDKLVAEGWKNLVYLPADDMFDGSGEGTVDGCHPNDLGMMTMAKAYGDAVAKALSLPARP